MKIETQNKLMIRAVDIFIKEFGLPSRKTVKVMSWNFNERLSAVIQIDQPNNDQIAYIWLPWPKNESDIPKNALKWFCRKYSKSMN